MAMEWFNGELSDAIASVKSSKKLLLVFVYGKDEENSKEFLTALEACTDVAMNYICLRLEASSVGAAQLNAFYPVMVVPLIYIINHDGRALESICGRATAAEIRQKLSSVENRDDSESAPAEPSVEAAEAVEEAPAEAAPPEAATDSPDGGADFAARQAAMQEQMLAVRRRKMAEEAEKERQQERQRREVGQRLTELKRQQREQEQRELREEIARKRKDEKEARERVKRQIEEDRRERMARSSAAASPPPEGATAAPTSPAAAAASPAAAEGDTRLQFRLPDGSNVVRSFRSTAPLQEAFDFISNMLEDRFGAFRLSSLYPRRLFGPDDMPVSLLDLALAPSAALVVMAGARAGGGASSGGAGAASASNQSGGVVQLALTPLIVLWGLLCSIFAALLAIVRPSPAAAAHAVRVTDGGTSGGASAGTASSNNAASARSADSVRQRRLGAINRLGDLPRDRDDDANTWNGNSTQQL